MLVVFLNIIAKHEVVTLRREVQPEFLVVRDPAFMPDRPTETAAEARMDVRL
jgi:hypothetical protein